MLKRFGWLFASVAFFTLLFGGSVSALKIAFPAYIYGPPNASYDAITGSSAVQILILNPASGPGAAANDGYTTQISKDKAAGKQSYGYVSTSYFAQSADTIKASIDKWKQFYPGIDGIFFDEANATAGSQQEWQDLISYASSKGMKSILNFGQDDFPSGLAGLDAILVNFEGDATTYLNKSEWNHRGSKYYHIVANVSNDLVNRVTTKAADYAGYVFMTNFPTDDSVRYSNLPTNWSQITAAVSSGGGGAVTTPSTPPGSTTPGTPGTPGDTTTPPEKSPFYLNPSCTPPTVSSGAGANSGGKAPAGNTACESGTFKGTQIEKDIQILINTLAIGVAVVVTIMIVIGGLQYMAARDNAQAVQAARTKITNAIIAMVSFLAVYAFLQWIVPGGIF